MSQISQLIANAKNDVTGILRNNVSEFISAFVSGNRNVNDNDFDKLTDAREETFLSGTLRNMLDATATTTFTSVANDSTFALIANEDFLNTYNLKQAADPIVIDRVAIITNHLITDADLTQLMTKGRARFKYGVQDVKELVVPLRELLMNAGHIQASAEANKLPASGAQTATGTTFWDSLKAFNGQPGYELKRPIAVGVGGAAQLVIEGLSGLTGFTATSGEAGVSFRLALWLRRGLS